jgi:hypothetical protein
MLGKSTRKEKLSFVLLRRLAFSLLLLVPTSPASLEILRDQKAGYSIKRGTSRLARPLPALARSFPLIFRFRRAKLSLSSHIVKSVFLGPFFLTLRLLRINKRDEKPLLVIG